MSNDTGRMSVPHTMGYAMPHFSNSWPSGKKG